MESFFVGLTLAAISGLVVMAVKYPNGYRNLFPSLMILNFVISLVFITFWKAQLNSLINILNDRLNKEQSSIQNTKDIGLRLGNAQRNELLGWGAFIAVIIFLTFLRYLQHIIEDRPILVKVGLRADNTVGNKETNQTDNVAENESRSFLERQSDEDTGKPMRRTRAKVKKEKSNLEISK